MTAVVEYNYEENGQLLVPAGTKAYGDLSQATPQGWVSINFHTRELPSGEQENINGSALSMDRGALRGNVNGKNTAKKFLTRTLTGVGTIAAFAVGGRGLSGNFDNSVLLRERISSTRPATSTLNTVPQITSHSAGSTIQATSTRDAASEQELSEMIQLRNELREMNRLMQSSAPRTGPSFFDNQ